MGITEQLWSLGIGTSTRVTTASFIHLSQLCSWSLLILACLNPISIFFPITYLIMIPACSNVIRLCFMCDTSPIMLADILAICVVQDRSSDIHIPR